MVAQTEIAGTVGNRNPESLAFKCYGSIHIYDVLLFMETVGGQNCKYAMRFFKTGNYATHSITYFRQNSDITQANKKSSHYSHRV